ATRQNTLPFEATGKHPQRAETRTCSSISAIDLYSTRVCLVSRRAGPKDPCGGIKMHAPRGLVIVPLLAAGLVLTAVSPSEAVLCKKRNGTLIVRSRCHGELVPATADDLGALAVGQKGDKGDQGTQGSNGDQGIQGPTGPRGFQGETGMPGGQGI